MSNRSSEIENVFSCIVDYSDAMQPVDIASKLSSLIVGMSVESAGNFLGAHKWRLRVMKTEKGNCIGTCDIVSNRVNVRTENEVVVEVMSVG